jgi:rhamnulose-1-phosphate aldolase/alcohol dehydrogenase
MTDRPSTGRHDAHPAAVETPLGDGHAARREGPAQPVVSGWDPELVPDDGLGQLVYRSNLLGGDRSVANFGGGNTSAKVPGLDHLGRSLDVLWVKGSGSDLATMGASRFTGLRLAEILPLLERDEMTDEEMVAYLSQCQLAPNMPRCSIETLLHAFIPAPHVDHTHPDAINMICGAANGERLARECFGEAAIWIPYIRPGFTLAKQIGLALASRPGARLVLLAKHGLVTWADTAEQCYESTNAVINQAVDFVNQRAAGPRFGGTAISPVPSDTRRDLLVSVLPVLRGAVSGRQPKVLVVDTSDAVMEFVCSGDAATLSQTGAACPDHLVHTKRTPLWIDFDRDIDDADALAARMIDGVAGYREEYASYVAERDASAAQAPDFDPNPRVVLIAGMGLVAIGTSVKAATLSRDLYHRAVAVIGGAAAIDEFVSLTEDESYAVEYWPLEQYKLSLAPPRKELAGMVALVTGGAGGIGRAVIETLAAHDACIIATDIDGDGAERAVSDLGSQGGSVVADVTDERAVEELFRQATLRFGGVDIVVSNAGLASSAPIEETTTELWDLNHDVLARGYFLVSRTAFRLLKRQGIGGSLVFVASKNALVAGPNAAAYSSAKAAELHLARCLAEEGGAAAIRVNTVNPDAVLNGSKIWGSGWREQRASAYGIDPDQLEDHYRARTTLKVNVTPEDVAQAVLFLASPQRSPKSTGNVVNVDGGVAAAYPR